MKIEDDFRKNLTYWDKKKNIAFVKVCIQSINKISEYSVRVSGSPFGSETYKHQWLLNSFSLAFMAVVMLQMGELKFGDFKVEVTDKILLLCSVFVILLSVLFLIRAYLEYSRSKEARNIGSHELSDLDHDLIDYSNLMIFQFSLWRDFSDKYYKLLDLSRKARSEYALSALDLKPERWAMRSDLTVPYFFGDDYKNQAEVSMDFVRSAIENISIDAGRFVNKVMEFDERMRVDFPLLIPPNVIDEREDSITKFQGRYLKEWMDLNDLIEEDFNNLDIDVVKDASKLKSKIMRKTLWMIRMVFVIDVILPFALALCSVAYCLYSKNAVLEYAYSLL